ncbi:MAG: 3-oxoacyl-ACP synthase III family protein [Halanaerobiaceae bacterium]
MNPEKSNLKFPVMKKKHVVRNCEILSTASFFPDRSLSNQDIINKYDLPFKSNVIEKAIGVKSRFVAEGNMVDSDLLSLSAKKCLKKISLSPNKLSRIIVNKFLGDNILPMTASRLQKKLGCTTAVHSYDIDGGISSFLYSLDTALNYINTGDEFILISSGGINYRVMDKKDPRLVFLFGDGSASIIVGFSEKQHILASYFYTNYYYLDIAISEGLLSLVSKIVDSNSDSIPNTYDTYRMDNWKKAEEFYRQAVKVTAENILTESHLTMENIDLVLVTENNCRIRELTLETLGVNEEKSISMLKDHGNTMSAMLPMLIDKGYRTGEIQKGMNIMIISLGEGISGGGLIYKV